MGTSPNTAQAQPQRPEGKSVPAAPVIDISTARNAAVAALSEDEKEQIFQDTSSLFAKIHVFETKIAQEEYKEACRLMFDHMDRCVKAGFLQKSADGKYEPANDTGEGLLSTFLLKIKELRKKTEKKKQVPKKPDAKAKKPAKKQPAAKQKSAGQKESPVAIEMDGQVFDTPQDALSYSNRLKADAEEFRQRYFGLLAGKVEIIDQNIETALEEISNADRIATKGDNVGLIDIMKPFIDRDIVRFSQGRYRGNPNIEKAKEIAEAATSKRTEISKKLTADKEAYEERKKRKTDYAEVLKSENGFEKTVVANGKEVAKFAYQIEANPIPGTAMKQITVIKVVPKFGNVRLQAGNTFVYEADETPRFLNKAAKILLGEANNKAGKKRITTVGEAARKTSVRKK